ncbi:MAG: LysM peptidoglycan-binding domain-containing protein [Lentimicrobiaceae bacterium]|nr:LysM peptidoglycan-binding domain-containing protein [Lentimicrobiaceae bacterium]
MKKGIFILIFLNILGCCFSGVFGQSQEINAQTDTTEQTYEFIKDDFIVASLDSLANLRYFEGFECPTDDQLRNVFGFNQGFVPVYADSVYYNRLKRLDANSPIALTYNQYVKDYIELYAIKKRSLTARVMGLAQIYFPLFEEQLDRFNMPLELKYLAIVESALNASARSPVGATGLWQFMYGTGKAYNLNVSSLVDDRRDPIKSTVAACQHMNDLYKMYNDWLLVLAAYNSGAGNVNKAIRRSGGKMDFWQIRPFLPNEARGYVPAFIAVNYVMAYAAEHNLKPVMPLYYHYDIDTVVIKDVLTFYQISELLNVPLEELQFLNPSYKNGIIPATPGNAYTLRLQKKNIPDFVNNEAALYAFRTQAEIEKEQVLAMMKTLTQAEYHKVKRGESLGGIAQKYRCSVKDLQRWNRLKGTTIQIGQRLIVRPESAMDVNIAAKKTKPAITPSTTAAKGTTEPETLVQNNVQEDAPAVKSDQKEVNVTVENRYHRVINGESLGRIANKYGLSVVELKKYNNLKNNTIHPGDNLIVGKVQTTHAAREVEGSDSKRNKNNDLDHIFYTVKQGDTLWKIARQHNGVSVDDLMKLNNIKNENEIKPGQRIKITRNS